MISDDYKDENTLGLSMRPLMLADSARAHVYVTLCRHMGTFRLR